MKTLFFSFALLLCAWQLQARTIVYTGTVSGQTVSSGGTAQDPLILDYTAANVTSTITFQNVAYVTAKGGTLTSAVKNQCFGFSGQSHDITIDGWKYTGPEGGTVSFMWLSYVDHLTAQNNTVDNVSHFAGGDTAANHDLNFLNNYCRTSVNTATQTDIIFLGDAANVLIQGNLFIHRAPGAQQNNHNDMIQCYQKGGSGGAPPTNWTLCYNWLEIQQNSGSGDNSWTMLENMNGNPAMRVFGNVFIGTGRTGNNGLCVNSCASSAVFYCYNNTFVRKVWNPDNTVRFMSPGKLNFRNNVMQSSPGISGTFVDNTMTAASTWDYNWFYNSTPKQNNSGPHGSTSQNPKFTSFDNNDFSLAPGSPLIASGDSLGSDYNMGIAPGATWPNPKLLKRTMWDVGAYVASGDAPSPTPSATPSPTATPNPSPSATPTPQPTATATPTPDTGWKVGQAVMATGFIDAQPPETEISVRQTPGGAVIGNQAVRSKGVIIEGPKSFPPDPSILHGVDTPWWRVDFNNGLDGWVGQVVIEN